jgi:hypothetical protein
MVRAMEGLVSVGRLSRVTVELIRPVPMAGFRVQAEIRRPGRSVVMTEAEIFDDDRVYARAFGLHLRTLDQPLQCSTAPFEVPDFERSVPGPFPIGVTRHGLSGFAESTEVRYGEGSGPDGGPTTMWMRTVPLLSDEEPSGFQRICALADCGNGISYNDYLDAVGFVNPDITLALVRQPVGEWLGARAVSHWQPDGIGLSDSELFDIEGPVGRAVQTLLLDTPAL